MVAVPYPSGDGRLAGSIAVGAVGVLFGSAFVGTAVVLRSFDPVAGAFWRATLATLMLLPVAGIRADPTTASDLAASTGSRLTRILILASLGGPAFLISMNLAVATSGAAISGFVVGQYAVFAAILAKPLLGEPVGRAVLIGLVAALAGTLLMAVRPGTDIAPPGILVGMAGAVAYALFIVLGRRWSRRYRLRPQVIALVAVMLTAVVAGLEVVAAAPSSLVPPAPDAASIIALVWVAFVLAAGQSVLMATLRRIDARRAATLLLLNPLTAALLAIVILGESLAGPQLAGAALVLTGMILAIRSG